MFDTPEMLCYTIGKYYVSNKDLIEYIVFKNAFDYFSLVLPIAYLSLIINFVIITAKIPFYFDIKKDVFLYKKKFKIIEKDRIYPFKLLYEILIISLEFQILGSIGVLISAKIQGIL